MTTASANSTTLGFDKIDADVTDFMTHKTDILGALGKAGDSAFHLRPGVEVQSPGNLTVDSDWNLYTARRAGGEPGLLTLRAAGDLIVKRSISDGFTTVAPGAALGAGASWSYRLTGGADLSGANPLAVAATPDGHFILAPNKLIRTGTGDISVASAGDVRIGYDAVTDSFTQPKASASVIYTAGEAGSIINPHLFKIPANKTGTNAANYTTRGGDISVEAGRDVTSAPSKQLVADWLWRRGKVNTDGTIAANQNATWWVNFANFQQGVGALGGGDISVKAGNNINNLSAVIPTNGRLAGAANSVPDAANLLIQRGGDLTVLAGGDINSGIFEVDRGHALINAGGSLGSARNLKDTNPGAPDTTPVYTLLVLGDSQADVGARKDAILEGALNSTALPASIINTSRNLGASAAFGDNSNIAATFFYTYSAESKLNLASIAGDLTLNNRSDSIRLD